MSSYLNINIFKYILIDSPLYRITINIILLFLLLLCIYNFLKYITFKFFNTKFFFSTIWFIRTLHLQLKSDLVYYARSGWDMTNVTTLDIELYYFLKPRVKKYLKNRRERKKEREKRAEMAKNITPHLTIYYPLETALVSVLIRFMGVLLLFLILLCLSITIICSIYNIYFYSIIFKLIVKNICIFLVVSTFLFHIYKAYKHF